MTDNYILRFIYDASGNVLGFEYLTPETLNDGITYYYEKNIFGDVVAIYDEYGTKVGAYGFNSYGQNHVVTNLTDDNIASLNPIRYRSYYYDADIYLYYLQSRYYDPVTCRFINTDGVIAGVGGDLRGYNLFAYCFNNPVSLSDPSGNWPEWLEKAKKYVEEFPSKASRTVRKTMSILFTKDFLEEVDDIVLSNVEADIGFGPGLGLTGKYSIVGFEAISRMDFLSVQFKDGKLRFGHVGRSAIAFSIGPITIGPQNDTFEDFYGDREVSDTYYFDIGHSAGQAFAFMMGFHWNASISYSGIVTDTYKYVKERW